MHKQFARPARGLVAVAAGIAFGVVGLACDSVLGIDNFGYGCEKAGVRDCLGSTPVVCGANGVLEFLPPCVDQACVAGECTGVCGSGDKECFDNKALTCDEDGSWKVMASCPYLCTKGECTGDCTEDDGSCAGNTPQLCDKTGKWKGNVACVDRTCIAGKCTGECAAGSKRCAGNTPQSCNGQGIWIGVLPCETGKECSGGTCTGDCTPGDVRCSGNTAQTCNKIGQWEDQTSCPQSCAAGLCMGPSCSGLADTCGPAANENCCISPVVPGGTYDRSNDPSFAATVSDFRLDRFEITVGRFRKFVDSYPGSKPASGNGAHPLIPGSGWNTAWDDFLPKDASVLTSDSNLGVKCSAAYQTWTDTPGRNENKPANCLSWHMAFAFCAWDGGRLPTEAEWNYAEAAGAEQRHYPWASPSDSEQVDITYAVYDCKGDGSAVGNCTALDILNVGSKSPKGDGRWGQADLGGSMWEWNLDLYKDAYLVPCDNCAALTGASFRVIRGGSWFWPAFYMLSSTRYYVDPSYRDGAIGFRCARSP